MPECGIELDLSTDSLHRNNTTNTQLCVPFPLKKTGRSQANNVTASCLRFRYRGCYCSHEPKFLWFNRKCLAPLFPDSSNFASDYLSELVNPFARMFSYDPLIIHITDRITLREPEYLKDLRMTIQLKMA